jgi:hypothetical protein
MKRIIASFGITGAIVPVILFIGTLIELHFNIKEVPLSRLLWPYLWPSSIFLAGSGTWPNLSLVDVLMLVLAVLVNVLLYALIGLMVGSVWLLISKRQP